MTLIKASITSFITFATCTLIVLLVSITVQHRNNNDFLSMIYYIYDYQHIGVDRFSQPHKITVYADLVNSKGFVVQYDQNSIHVFGDVERVCQHLQDRYGVASIESKSCTGLKELKFKKELVM